MNPIVNLKFLLQRELLKQNAVVLLVFGLCLLAGLLTFKQYGASWDENLLQIYADQSLKSYSTWRNKGDISFEHDNLKHYGPFYVMTVEVLTRFFGKVASIGTVDLRHLIYFFTYFAGMLAFYDVSRRWFSRITSIGATLLFMLQPVLWGHAFINPKDTPFLSLTLLSLAAGFRLVDAVQSISAESPSFALKPRALIVSLIWLVSVFALFSLTEVIHYYIGALVTSAKAGEANIVSLLASKLNQVPAKVYIQRYFVLYLKIRTVYFILSTAVLLYIWHRSQPILLKVLAVVAVPAALLGFATSTRVLGPFVGVVIVYGLIRSKARMAPIAIVMYAVIAMIAAYLTWPFLWLNPLGNLLESLTTMSAYPWQGSVLFDGEMHQASDLPAFYLPMLLILQLTEPAWLLAATGLGIAVFNLRQRTELLALFAFWFLLPVTALMIKDTVLYDNFRQVLFILPPLFLMAGVVFEKIVKPGWRIAVIAMCLLPGIIGIVSLHPYEYAYYNQFIGGISGAQGRFETDYWLTSYREAAEYVNENASPNAAIWVQGPGHLFTPFARADLIVNSWSRYEPVESYEYVIVSSRLDEGETSYPDAEIVHRIMRGDAVLTVIKKP
jgi:hypothetical protein